jgi:hypothetical protein
MGYNILDVAKDALTGNLKMTTTEEQEKRLSICRNCEYLIKIPGNTKITGTCKKCGCFMDAKVKFVQASCPLGKW